MAKFSFFNPVWTSLRKKWIFFSSQNGTPYKNAQIFAKFRFCAGSNPCYLSTVLKIKKFTLSKKYFVKSTQKSSVVPVAVVQPMISRNFCQKSVRENFCNIHTVLPKALSILDEWMLTWKHVRETSCCNFSVFLVQKAINSFTSPLEPEKFFKDNIRDCTKTRLQSLQSF